MGLAEEGRSAWEMEDRLNLGNRVGMKALERAAAHHRRALTVRATLYSGCACIGTFDFVAQRHSALEPIPSRPSQSSRV